MGSFPNRIYYIVLISLKTTDGRSTVFKDVKLRSECVSGRFSDSTESEHQSVIN